MLRKRTDEFAAVNYFEKAVIELPEIMETILDVREKLNRNFYDHPDWYGQYFENINSEYWSLLTFARLHTLEILGEISFYCIDVGAFPSKDKSVKLNNQKLKRGLPHYAYSVFNGGTGDNDGYIQWTKSIYLYSYDINNIKHGIILPPGRCPLEVGYTKYETTYRHLFSENVLARWPYERDYIIIMGLTNPKNYIRNMNWIPV
jgi:hypothetical protein